MNNVTPDFYLEVEGIKGTCPVGEAYATQNDQDGKIPVFACEGPCIRGEIARQAANLIARETPSCARACHAEAFFVPHSAMTRWAREADKSIMVDGCFLKCHRRVLDKLVGKDKVIHFDAFAIHGKYSDIFLMEDVPEAERNAVAREVADAILPKLQQLEPANVD